MNTDLCFFVKTNWWFFHLYPWRKSLY